MSRGRRRLFGIATVLLTLLVGAALLEGVLRLTADPRRFYPYHPNHLSVFYPSETVTPGISGPSYFSTNSFGCRGPEPAGERWRLVTLGGSTTACTALDDAETWPALVMQYVNEARGDPRALWVTNAGMDGRNSANHLMHAKYLVPVLPKIDYVLVYAGLNEAAILLNDDTDFDRLLLEDPSVWEDTIARSFRVSRYAKADAPWYRRLELHRAFLSIKDNLRSRARRGDRDRALASGSVEQDAQGRWMQELAERRYARPFEPIPAARLARLPGAVAAYGGRLGLIADAVREAGAVPIFMAQALRWKGVSEEERKRIWMGAMNRGEAFISEADAEALILAYNEEMRKIAATKKVLFIDLSAALEGEKEIFFDGTHFNEHGARVVARHVAGVLQTKVLPLAKDASRQ